METSNRIYQHSRKWNMPSRYYHKQFGPCDLHLFRHQFGYDRLNKKILTQLSDVKNMIRKSTQPWKILWSSYMEICRRSEMQKKDVESFLTELMSEKDYTIDAYFMWS